MVEFAGWHLPVSYEGAGGIEEHMHTRTHTSLFDVSHMLQMKVTGPSREDFVERMTVADVQGLEMGSGCYSLLMNEAGGIEDDTIVHRHEDHVSLVLNAGCAEKDLRHLHTSLEAFEERSGVELHPIEGKCLVALQGPGAHAVLAALWDRTAVDSMPFMAQKKDVRVAGISCTVTRCGYTGEDGFEIAASNEDAEELAAALLGQDGVRLAGLGARDSLRLEAGLVLYGHDLQDTVSPIEAALRWTISKRRQNEGGFLGFARFLDEAEHGVSRRRVGLKAPPGRVLREGTKLFASNDLSGEAVGEVTSGLFSPVLQHPLAMAYVQKPHHKMRSKLFAKAGKKAVEVAVSKMPFVPSKYYSVPSN